MLVITSRVAILFALVFLGYYLGKRKIMSPDVAPQISNLIIMVTFPAMTFLSMVRPFDGQLLKECVIIVFGGFAMHFGGLLVGLIVTKIFRVDPKSKGTWLFVSMFTNNGFMGIPLIYGVYGDDGMMLIVFANIATNILIFSVGKKAVTLNYDAGAGIKFREMFLTNINLAAALGIIFFIFQIPVPEVVQDGLGYVSDLTAGLSMIVVGLSLTKIPIRTIISGKDMWIMAVVRLLVIPIIIVAVFRFIPGAHGTLLEKVLVLMSALPSASTVSLLSEKYGTNTELAAKMVFSTTLLSVVTIPFVMSFVV